MVANRTSFTHARLLQHIVCLWHTHSRMFLVLQQLGDASPAELFMLQAGPNSTNSAMIATTTRAVGSRRKRKPQVRVEGTRGV